MKKYCLLYVIAIVMALYGCQNGHQERSGDLVVVEQSDTVNGTNEENYYQIAVFNIDAPVDGPQALVDSIIAFLNKEMYNHCEDYANPFERGHTFSPEDVYTNEAENLLSAYMNQYRATMADSLPADFFVTIKLLKQTESYATYFLENVHCGASCGSEIYFYTFDKSNGHLLTDVISQDNLVQFFNDHPQYKDHGGLKVELDYLTNDATFGLDDDTCLFTINKVVNHYVLYKFSSDSVFSYLSPEAQKYLKGEKQAK